MILKNFFLTMILNLSLLACAGGWDFNEKEFIFLEKRAQPFSNISEDIKSPNVYNTIYWDYEKRNKELNLQEWQEKLKNQFSIKEIEEFIYLGKNIEKIKDKEIQEYIYFVKKQEKHVSDGYYSKKELEKLKDYNLLLNEAIQKIETVKSSYLKLRYFYLALRIAHFKNKEPLSLYSKYKYLLDTNNDTIVKHWIQGLYAGALIKNKQEVFGVYEFTKLFDKNIVNWHLTYYNFHHIKTNKQWNELLNLAKDNEEKTKFYAIRALNENSNILEELRNIYAVDKNSKWFDFVLYRELLNTQHFFDQNPQMLRVFPYKKYIELLTSINKDNMYLVDLSLAYFNLYENNLTKTAEILEKLKTNYPNSHEVKTLEYILYLHNLQKVDLNKENEIYEKMEILTKNEDTSTSIHDYTFVILEKIYKKQNDIFKAFLSEKINYLMDTAFDLESLEKFRIFMEEPKKSKIEEHFANRYLKQNILKKVDNNFLLSDELEKAKLKLLISNLKFEDALKSNSEYLHEEIEFNPFNATIKGNNRNGKKNTYTVKIFLEKIIEIKNQLKINPNSAMDNYLYANALYNLSYFGNANTISTIYRSVYSFTDKEHQEQKLKLAKEYYEKALKYSKNKEFKAKITYMLAKVELASFDIKFSHNSPDYFNSHFIRYSLERYWSYKKDKIYDEFIKNDFGEYFDKLKKDYSDTKYYKELIKECANLRIYENKK